MVRPSINSEKHIRQIPINERIAGGVVSLDLVKVEEVRTLAEHVRVGAVIKAVYVELWVQAGANQPGSITLIVQKLPTNTSNPTLIDMADLNGWHNKKNILYTTQGLTPDANGNPVPFVRMWIKIPKGKQRFGLGDSLTLSLSAAVENASHCGLAIFKEYY